MLIKGLFHFELIQWATCEQTKQEVEKKKTALKN